MRALAIFASVLIVGVVWVVLDPTISSSALQSKNTKEADLVGSRDTLEDSPLDTSENSTDSLVPPQSLTLEGSAKTRATSNGQRKRVTPAGFELFLSVGVAKEHATQIHFLPMTEELGTYILESQGEAGGAAIAKQAAEIVLSPNQGKVDLSSLMPGMEYFAWCESPGFQIEPRLLQLPLSREAKHWVMNPASPIQVNVVDEQGNPLVGIKIDVQPRSDNPEYFEWGWRKRLAASFFERQAETDAQGSFVLHTPLVGGVSIKAGPHPGYAWQTKHGVFAGEEMLLRMHPTLRIRGRILDPSGRGVSDGMVAFFSAAPGGGSEEAGSAFLEKGGTYALEVDASPPMLMAMAFCEGYAPVLLHTHRPRPGEDRELDFHVEPAVTLSIKLETESRTPLANWTATFSSGPWDWVPGHFTTDATGFLQTDSFFVAGKTYQMELFGNDQILDPIPVLVPASEDKVVAVQVAGLARIEAVNRLGGWEDPPKRISWSWRGLGGPSWSPETTPSPWLQAGSGRLLVELQSGRELRQELVLRGHGIQVQFPETSPFELRFTLPEAEKAWSVVILDDGGFPAHAQEGVTGVQELLLEPGEWILRAEAGDQRVNAGPIRLTSDLDLGLLFSSTGLLAGWVEDEKGRPWPQMGISLLRWEDGLFEQVLADAKGQFSFSQLPGGRYQLTVLAWRTGLLDAPDLVTEVILGAGEVRPDLKLVLRRPNLSVRVPGGLEAGMSAFAVDDSSLQRTRPNGQGLARLGRPTGLGWAGVLQASAGSIQFASGATDPQTESLTPEWGQDRRSWSFVEESGEPFPLTRFDLELNGNLWPRPFTLSKTSSLQWRADPGLPIALRFSLPGGGSLRFRPSEHPSGSVVLGSLARAWPLLVTDLASTPMTGAEIFLPLVGERFLVNRDGRSPVFGPAEEFMVVEMAGRWSVHTSLGKESQIFLRQTAGRTFLQTAEGLQAVDLFLEPQFELGYSWIPKISKEGATAWEISEAPEGNYRLTAFNKEEVPVASVLIQLTPQEGNAIQIR